MMILRVPAVVAAVLFMSSVSVEAAGFADRPDMLYGNALQQIVHVSKDRLRRQISSHIVFPTAPRLILNFVRIPKIHVALAMTPGRLSPEFSPAIRRPAVNFETWSRLGSGRYSAMTFKDQPGPMSKRVRMAAPRIIRFDRPAFVPTPKKTAAVRLHSSPSSVNFCVGSMAPCGSLSFAQPSRPNIRSAAYLHDERL
jgi:hypothetical protein